MDRKAPKQVVDKSMSKSTRCHTLHSRCAPAEEKAEGPGPSQVKVGCRAWYSECSVSPFVVLLSSDVEV